MYDKQNIIQDILIDLNEICTTILSAQDGNKPPFPFAELNITSEVLENEFEEIKYTEKVDSLETEYKNNILLNLSITHHSENNLDDGINNLIDYFRDMSDLEAKYGMAVVLINGIQNRNTVLNVDYYNSKGFDVSIRVDDKFVDTETYIEQVEI